MAATFLTFTVLGAIATLGSVTSSRLELNLLMLLALTSGALFWRNATLRKIAIPVNAIGLLMPWLSASRLNATIQDGSLAFHWRSSLANALSPQQTFLFTLLESSIWAGALFVLLKRDARNYFAQPSRRNASGLQLSHWSIYGAISVGLSLPVPFAAIVALISGRGGIGPAELWLALGSVALPGLGGTLLGWLGLNEIRESRGRVRGLPLAMFATLLWPLTIFGALTVGVPMFWAVPGGEPTTASTIGRFLVMLLPAAVTAFSIWASYSTARWAGQKEVVQQRGMLKWAFILVLLIGVGVVLVTNPGQRHAALQPPQPIVGGTSVEAEERPAPLRANFRFAKGHVVTFEVMRRVGENDYEPVPHFAGYAVAPDEERGRFSLMLTPETSNSSTNPLRWTLRLISETGSSAVGSSASLGELISMLPTNHWHQIDPDGSFGLYLTQAYPGADTNGLAPLAELSLAVRSEPRGKTGLAPENTMLNIGSTNWVPALTRIARDKPARRAQPGEVLASQWLKSPAGTNTPNWIQFTFTNVELRNEDGQQWLAMGYLTDVHGDCEEVFAVDGHGFNAVTRKTGWRTASAGSPPVEYSGIQWLVPPGIDSATLESFRKSVAEALVAKSFVIPEGEQRPLIRFPIGKVGILSVGIGTKLKLTSTEKSISASSALEFRLIANDPDSTSPVDELPERQRNGNEIKHRVLRTIMLDGSSVDHADVVIEPTGAVTIGVKLTQEGARQFGAVTAANTGRRMAIVSQGRVLSAPFIRSAITGGQISISGAFSTNEASRLVAALNRQPEETAAANEAAAELWSPKLAAGEKPNVSEILQEAKRLTDAGRFEEALQRHIWYHNHALKIQPSQAGVRLSFALMYWGELAQRYPKAKEALNEIVDRGTQAFADGEGHYALFVEVSAIHRQLGRQKETLALFETIESQDPRLARQCYGVVEDLLVEKGDYALCESFIPDFQKRFETLRADWQKTVSDRSTDASRESLRQYARQKFIKDTRKLVEILVGVSRNAEAGTIRDQAVAALDVPELRSALTDAEQKVASHSVVPAKP